MRHRLVAFFCVLFIFGGCDDGSSGSLAIDDNGVSSSSTPQDYCVTLEKIEVRGDLTTGTGLPAAILAWLGSDGGKDPALYGKLCGTTSEDENITADIESIGEKIRNCRDFFFATDDTPLTSDLINREVLDSLIKNFAPDTALPPEELLDIYRGNERAPPLKLVEDNNDASLKYVEIKKSMTFRLEDKRNHRILLVGLPIFVRAQTAISDNPLYPKSGFTTAAKKLPGILEILDRDVPALSGVVPLRKNLVFSLDPDSPSAATSTFIFTVHRRSCTASEEAHYRETVASTTPTPGDSSTTKPSEPVSPLPAPTGFPYCVKLNSVDISGDWDHSGFSLSKGNIEFSGQVCAVKSTDPDFLDTNKNITERLSNCRSLLRRKSESNPLNDYLTNSLRMENLSNSAGVTSTFADLSSLYDGFRLSTALHTGNRPLNKNATLHFSVGENNSDVVLVFLPFLDKDTASVDGNDDLLSPSVSSFGNQDYPAVLRVSRQSIDNADASGLTRQVEFTSRGDELTVGADSGSLRFNFTLSPAACSN